MFSDLLRKTAKIKLKSNKIILTDSLGVSSIYDIAGDTVTITYEGGYVESTRKATAAERKEFGEAWHRVITNHLKKMEDK